MKNFTLISFLMLFFGSGVFAQRNFFQPVSGSQLPQQAREVTKQVRNKGVYKLDEKAMRTYLLRAPLESRSNGLTVPLDIPLPDGTTETFNMVESPILSPAVAARHPEIKTYSGNGQNDKKAVIRISFTSSGFNAVIFNLNGDAVYFEPYSTTSTGTYFNYFAKDLVAPKGGVHRDEGNQQMSTQERIREKAALDRISAVQKNRSFSTNTPGSAVTLKTYRLAFAADAEFVAHNGGTVTSGFNAVVAYVNRIIAFYRKELAVSFSLVSDENLIYTNAATDPYDNDDQVAMLNQNLANCNAVIGTANYDIGHVFGYAGSSGGGIASFASLCVDAQKGRGVSGEGDLSEYAQVFQDQLVFHEMGHQFGMSHSYNSSIPVCTTREPTTSVEPGSGATIMSYGFTCGDDDYFETSAPRTGPILAFHTVSAAQGLAYISTISCGTSAVTANISPVVTVPGNYTIPKSTPFALTGSATDGNGDALTYSWEGTNIGTMTPDNSTLANTAQPPFFRSYEPSTSPTRTYPILSAILDGSNYAKGDKLPSVGIATTHTLTVRDYNAAAGGVSTGSVTVTIDGNTGPFLITSNLAASYNGNSSQTITWSVNGTNTATPNVKISLSTDGGQTFPTVLLASTPNDGTQPVTLPNITTSTARIKVEAIGNIYFDISNSNFSISTVATTFNIISSTGANGTISPLGTTSVTSGASQTYTITPTACYRIATVLVDGVSVGTPTSYTFTNVTATHTISVTFTQNTYAITATSGANGTVTPAGATTINCGASQTYTITPATGYAVQSVLVDGISVGAVSSYTFSNVTATHTISASFTASAYIITTNTGANGAISPSGGVSVASGASQTFTITPNTCYRIATVLVDGVSVGTPTSYTFTNVTANHSISATFAQNTYAITATSGANGTVTPGGATSVNCGSSQVYTITPAAGYSILNVLVDGTSAGAVSSYTFNNVSSIHTISATFAVSGFTPLYRINAGGNQVTNSIGTFSADNYYSPTPGLTYSTTADIAGTTDDAIYQTERFTSSGVLNYAIPVSSGQYKVVLHFAEIFFNTVNARVFDVSLEGTKVLDNYDIYKKVGAYTATTETFTINVTDGTLNLYISSLAADGGINNGKVSAIEVLKAGANMMPVANAGPDKTIALPVTSTTLSGSGTDGDGTISAYTWAQVSGPNTAAFSSKTVAAPTVSGLVPGNYKFSLVVTDGSGSVSTPDTVAVTVINGAAYRINAGGNQVTNSIGTFGADAYYSPTPGLTYSTTADIAGTTDDAIYQTDRFTSTGTLGYAFPVTNGSYTVVLHFAETFFNSVNARVFDVSLEGTKVLDNYDIYKKVGSYTATTETFPVTVTDGILNINFSSLAADGGINNAKVCAIEVLWTSPNALPVANAGPDKAIITPASTTTLSGSGTDTDGNIAGYTWTQASGPNTATFNSKTIAAPSLSGLVAGTYVFSLTVTDNGGGVSAADQVTITVANTVVYRINAGAGQVVNSIGTFAADNYFSPTPGLIYSTNAAIAGTTDPAIYQSERFTSSRTLNYAFPVTNGQYIVVLHFAEIFFNAVNARLFDLSLEGIKVLDNYDIYKKVGAYTATTETFTVNVTDGTLNLYISSLAADGGIDNGKINAIEILKVTAPGATGTVTKPAATAGREAAVQKLIVQVNPNPTRNAATFRITGGDNKPLTMRIFSADGRIIETRANITPNGPIQVGSLYSPGMYYGEILQGTEKVTVKFIKLK